MNMRMSVSVVVAAVCAFIASSLWYSSVLFGAQFLALSGLPASITPVASKVAMELLRNVILASVICWLLSKQGPVKLTAALVLAAALWLGFPFILLSGSVMWQGVPLVLALIHAGDWFVKIGVVTLLLWLINLKSAVWSAQLA